MERSSLILIMDHGFAEATYGEADLVILFF